MILVDTNVLAALIDERDGLHKAAAAHLRKLKKHSFGIPWAVLVETYFLLQKPYERRRLRFLIDQLGIAAVPHAERNAVLDWMEKYEEHEPDLADAELVILSQDRAHKVWTYDAEFRTTWKRTDGTAVPLAVRHRG